MEVNIASVRLDEAEAFFGMQFCDNAVRQKVMVLYVLMAHKGIFFELARGLIKGMADSHEYVLVAFVLRVLPAYDYLPVRHVHDNRRVVVTPSLAVPVRFLDRYPAAYYAGIMLLKLFSQFGYLFLYDIFVWRYVPENYS